MFRTKINPIFLLCALISLSLTVNAETDKEYGVFGNGFAGGAGTLEEPYLISLPEHLNNMRSGDFQGVFFELTQDIDLDSAPYNAGDGWEPIPGFDGHFDGKGFSINNLYINRPEYDSSCGLFGLLLENGTLKNITLRNINVTGQASVGGLAGYNVGLIKGCRVIGGTVVSVKDAGDPDADFSGIDTGGMVGVTGFGSRIENSRVSGVNVTGSRLIGGLAGWSEGGLVARCVVTGGTVTGEEDVGGLLGTLDKGGRVEYSSSSADVFGIEQASYIGGLIGVTYKFDVDDVGFDICVVKYSKASGSVTGKMFVGGLVGINTDLTEIKYSYATGNVTGEIFTGGLAGGNIEDSLIQDCFASGNVTGIDYTGGLVGMNGIMFRENGDEDFFPAYVRNSYAVSNVSASGDLAGGLIGSQRIFVDDDGFQNHDEDIGVVENSFWNTDIKAAGVGSGESAGSTGKTTAEMRKAETFTGAGWDFTGTWAITEDTTYPFLRWDHLPFCEGFEIWPPKGWNIYELGPGARTWEQSHDSYGGDHSAFHGYSHEGFADSWLVSPPVAIPSGTKEVNLSFYEKNFWIAWYDYSGVWISSGSGDPSHEDFIEISESNENMYDWTKREIDITDYAGETVFVAFRYSGEKGHDWWIDKFCIDFSSLAGDINGDGEITIADVILCLRIAIGLSVTIGGSTYGPPEEYPEWLIEAADVNGDDVVNISDVILILRKAVGLED